VGIIGYGRFGAVLADLLNRDFELLIFDERDVSAELEHKGLQGGDLVQVMQQDTIFLAVPIGRFPEILARIAPLCSPHQLIIDVASVKTRIRDWMVKLLPENVEILNTHPMFGPDSITREHELRLVFCPTRLASTSAHFWRQIFQSWGCQLIDLSVEEHDEQAARSQGITHFVGRVMKGMGIKPTLVDTHGFRQVHHVVEQTCGDTEELFHDLQFYNPYTAAMLTDFSHAVHAVKARIYRPDSPPAMIGYQGLPGSFSEEATRKYIQEEQLGEIETLACISSQGVLDKLANYTIDRGIIAMENARGGVVHESIHALASARCRVRKMFHIQVDQCLISRLGLALDQITEVRSHPQALKQCSRFLEQEFSQVPQFKATDTAAAARHLSQDDYTDTTAVIAPARAAEIYGLQVLRQGVQDLQDNQTLFLVIERSGMPI